MPRSRNVRMTRTAISPRLATSTRRKERALAAIGSVQDDAGHGEAAVVRDRDMGAGGAEYLGALGRSPVENQRGLAAAQVHDFDRAEGHAARPAGAERLHARFLGREARRPVARGLGMARAVRHFG